jgi:hypothetical protein
MPPDFSKGSGLRKAGRRRSCSTTVVVMERFLSLMSDKFSACVGADIEPEQVDDCRRRFATVPNVTFCLVQELNGTEHTRPFGVVTCMEMLEHCTDSTGRQCLGGPRSSVLARWNGRHQRTH